MANKATEGTKVAEAPVPPHPIEKEFQDIRKDINENVMMDNTFQLDRCILMVGGADFFVERDNRYRQTPYELVRLFELLKSKKKGNENDSNDIVFAFDENYTNLNIINDIKNVNTILGLNFSIPSIITHSSLWPMASYDFTFGCTIYFFKHNLQSMYPQFLGGNTQRNLIMGNTTLQTIVETCVPKPGSIMLSVQNLLKEYPFKEYYLYNCAWIKTSRFFEKNGKYFPNTGYENRYFEMMCELLHIFRNLPKPSHLLSGKGMQVFKHNKETFLSKTENLKITPLNETTQIIKLEPKTGGTTKRMVKRRAGKTAKRRSQKK